MYLCETLLADSANNKRKKKYKPIVEKKIV